MKRLVLFYALFVASVLTASARVTISSPADGSTALVSPVTITAASSTQARLITVYMDFRVVYRQTWTARITTKVAASPGPHRIWIAADNPRGGTSAAQASFVVGGSKSVPNPEPTPSPTPDPAPTPTPSPDPTPSVPAGYSLKFADEFDGTALSSKWRLGYYFSNTVPASAVSVNNGAAHLTWTRGGVPDISISGTQTFNRGYFEIRMKWPVAVGAWPAFWAIPSCCVQHTGEVDVFEGQGSDPTTYYATLHEWNGSTQLWQTSPNNFNVPVNFNEWHTYGLLWTAGGHFVWYLDGQIVHSATGPSIFDTQSVFPILSMQEGNDWRPGNTSGVSVNNLTMDVDYFRVYQQ